MKKFSLCAAVLSLAVASQSQAALVITEVMSSSGSGGTGDWFELTNFGSAAVSLTGYKMDDNSFDITKSVSLNGVSLIAAGESITFIETTTADPASEVAAFRSFWGGAAATGQIGTYTGSGVSLSATADGVVIFDNSGAEVTRVNFGVATTGASFGYNSVNGFGEVSTVGVDGAYTSANALGNVGSPDVTAVPEPSTNAMFAVGALSILGWLRFGRKRALRA